MPSLRADNGGPFFLTNPILKDKRAATVRRLLQEDRANKHVVTDDMVITEEEEENGNEMFPTAGSGTLSLKPEDNVGVLAVSLHIAIETARHPIRILSRLISLSPLMVALYCSFHADNCAIGCATFDGTTSSYAVKAVARANTEVWSISNANGKLLRLCMPPQRRCVQPSKRSKPAHLPLPAPVHHLDHRWRWCRKSGCTTPQSLAPAC